MWVSDSCSASLFTLSSHTAASQGLDQDGHGDHGGHHEHDGDKNYDDDYEKQKTLALHNNEANSASLDREKARPRTASQVPRANEVAEYFMTGLVSR